jgi:hypothetical protein
MYVIIKENSDYYPSIINMDNVTDVTIDENGSSTKEYRLLFSYCTDTHDSFYFENESKAAEQLMKIQNAIKKKQRYVELKF